MVDSTLLSSGDDSCKWTAPNRRINVVVSEELAFVSSTLITVML